MDNQMQTLKPLSTSEKEQVLNLFDNEVKFPMELIIKNMPSNESKGKSEKEITDYFINSLMNETWMTRSGDSFKFSDSDSITTLKKFIVDNVSIFVLYRFYNSMPMHKTCFSNDECIPFTTEFERITGVTLKGSKYFEH